MNNPLGSLPGNLAEILPEIIKTTIFIVAKCKFSAILIYLNLAWYTHNPNSIKFLQSIHIEYSNRMFNYQLKFSPYRGKTLFRFWKSDYNLQFHTQPKNPALIGFKIFSLSFQYQKKNKFSIMKQNLFYFIAFLDFVEPHLILLYEGLAEEWKIALGK